MFGKQKDELSKSLLRSFVNNGYSAYDVTPDNIPQIEDIIRTKTPNFGVIGVNVHAQQLMDAFGTDRDADMLALVNPIISGNETVVGVNPQMPLLIYYNTFSKQYDEQNTNALYNRLYAQSNGQSPAVKLILDEQVWHNYDDFVWRILTDCTEFAANTFNLPLTIERQELRTWYLFFVFFAIYLMCDFEIFKSRHKKEHRKQYKSIESNRKES